MHDFWKNTDVCWGRGDNGQTREHVGAVPIYLSMPPVANSNQHSALCPALMLLLRLVLISLLLILEHLAE